MSVHAEATYAGVVKGLAILLEKHHQRPSGGYEGSELAKRTAEALFEFSNYGMCGCGMCHTCWNQLTRAYWCSNCGKRRRYACHGYVGDDRDRTKCNQKVTQKTKMGALIRIGKRIYSAACGGDLRAAADLRAVVERMKKIKSNHKTKAQETTMKKLTTSLAALALALITVGCKNTSPAVYSLGTATIVSYGLRNSPQTAGYLRAVQPVACSLATGTNLNPAQVVHAIETSGIANSAEGRLIVNGVLLLYITAYDGLGSSTNAAAVRPYAQAVFCDGFALGLADAPTSEGGRKAKPLPTKWPLLKP